MAELSHRARQILYAAVTEFVATGSPVGSRTLSKKCGIDLSPATIRNVLSDLEEMGFLHQPHTSAGRVPTDRAFRLFIDALMELRELSEDDHARIHDRFERMKPGQNVWREAGKLLSELTGTAAVVVAPKAETQTLKHLRFIRTVPGEILAVLVMSNGVVQNRFLKATVDEAELARMHVLLDDVIEGRTLGELRDLFARRLAGDRIRHDETRRRAFELGEAVLGGIADATADVVIEGRAKLLGQPEFQGAEGMASVVSALDERERIVGLLDATLAARGADPRTRAPSAGGGPRDSGQWGRGQVGAAVVVGNEAGELGGGQLAIVGAAYTDHGRAAGSVGVIGPTRMDYPKVVPLVAATANAMSAYIERAGTSIDDAGDDDDDES